MVRLALPGRQLAALISLCLVALIAAGGAHAGTPFTPAADAEVVERLPGRGGDPALRQVESLRRQFAARPNDAALRLEVARRYFDLAMAQGDPRYVGYAAAAIGPLAKSEANNPAYWVMQGLIQQYGHDFTGAMASLERAGVLDPQAVDPVTWRAAIHMVQARYPQALGECTRLVGLGQPLLARGCTAYAQAASGQLAGAYAGLNQALEAAGPVEPGIALWLRTRLAEMALRLQRPAEAEAHFRRALDTGVTDQFLLGAYADFLLLQRRPAEAVRLLADWERSDILLLRLALAGKAMNHPKAADWAGQLRERFAAAALRGDKLHEQEAARFALDIENQPARALALALENYQTQKEPRDAQVLMQAAVAAGQAKAAQPALAWYYASGYEDRALKELADQLVAAGATR